MMNPSWRKKTHCCPWTSNPPGGGCCLCLRSSSRLVESDNSDEEASQIGDTSPIVDVPKILKMEQISCSIQTRVLLKGQMYHLWIHSTKNQEMMSSFVGNYWLLGPIWDAGWPVEAIAGQNVSKGTHIMISHKQMGGFSRDPYPSDLILQWIVWSSSARSKAK